MEGVNSTISSSADAQQLQNQQYEAITRNPGVRHQMSRLRVQMKKFRERGGRSADCNSVAAECFRVAGEALARAKESGLVGAEGIAAAVKSAADSVEAANLASDLGAFNIQS